MAKKNIVTRGLVGFGNVIHSGIEGIKKRQAYKQSPEYREKVMANLKFQRKVMEQKAKIAKLQGQMPNANPFGGDPFADAFDNPFAKKRK